MTSSKNLEHVIATPYQLGTLYIKYRCLIDICVKFGDSELISYVPARSHIVSLKYPKNVMMSSKNLKYVIVTSHQLGNLYIKYHYLIDI